MFTNTNPFETSSDRISSRLLEFELPGSIGSSTYLPHSDVKFTTVSASPARNNTPDTTAVVLNWSRLENVVLISAVLCGPWLSSTIAQVLIWNNNPNITLGMKNFRGTGCSAEKLRIHNSPSNIYFRARFIACAEAQTPFCFIQDDDYLIRPEILQNMHAFFIQSPSIPSLHLLPAHEHLVSRLRTISTVDGLITTSFAWLGHGTFLSRSVANDFLSLLHDLEADEEALKMADNYFTILANRPKQEEIWFDHGIELGGGQPFTVGPEGDARNDRHITQALTYLSTLVAGNAASSSPYISCPNISHTDVNMAPCRLASCLVKSNIELLPDYQRSEVRIAEDMVPEAQRQWRALGQEQTQWYMQNSLSTIVDGRSETAFHSREAARKGDWIALDILDPLTIEKRTLEFSFLIDEGTEHLFRRCAFSTSVDGAKWDNVASELRCSLDSLNTVDGDGITTFLRECSVGIYRGTARHFRVTYSGSDDLISNEKDHWVVNEVWLRFVL